MTYNGGKYVLLNTYEYKCLKEIIHEADVPFTRECPEFTENGLSGVYVGSGFLRRWLLELMLASFILADRHRCLTKNLKEVLV